MSNRIQTIRSGAAGVRPATGANLPGVVYTNWPDRQIGVLDSGRNPLDLIAVRFFSTTATYAVGDHTLQAGAIYRANGVTGPGAFVPAKWDKLANAADIAAAVALYLPLTGGVLTGPLAMGGVIPAGARSDSLIGRALTADTLGLNAYRGPGGLGDWRAVTAGYLGLIAVGGAGDISFWTSTSVAAGASPALTMSASIDASSNFVATGSVTATTNLIGRGATYLSYNNATDFLAVASTTDRVFYWSSPHWADYWHNADGSRHWTGWNGSAAYDCMSMDGAGNLAVRGQVQAGGAIITPSTVQGNYVHSLGNVAADADMTCRSLYATTTVQGATLHSTGGVAADLDVSASRNLGVSGSAFITGNATISGTLSVGTFAPANINYSGNLTSTSFYGHAYAFGWNGSGTRHRVDNGDQGYLVRADNFYSLHWAGNAVNGAADGGHAFAWNVFAALTREEAQAKADEAQADIATIKNLRAQVEALTARVAAMEGRI